MAQVKNITTGARGAYLKGELVMAEAGETVEADDFVAEWFEPVKGAAAKAKPEAE